MHTLRLSLHNRKNTICFSKDICMKLAIVGSREFGNYRLLCDEVDKIRAVHTISAIVSGGAKGADTLAKRYAEENRLPLVEFFPDYSRFRRAAPLQRNSQIVNYADCVLAFVTVASKGTWDTIRKAEQAKKQVIIVTDNSEDSGYDSDYYAPKTTGLRK